MWVILAVVGICVAMSTKEGRRMARERLRPVTPWAWLIGVALWVALLWPFGR